MAAAAGFLLASRRHIDLWLLLALLAGMALVIAGACVANNYIDREIDQKMARTRRRALVQGTISGNAAIIYSVILSLAGFAILAVYTNWLTVFIGLVGIFFYVVVYGWGKRATVHGTVIGSVSGSMPLVAGYTAVTDKFDGGAVILFLIMTFWQMPHFYAIAMYRFNDYKAAKLPVLPVVKGMRAAKVQILLYVAAFAAATAALSLFGYAGFIYLIATVFVSLIWFWKGLQGFKAIDDAKWARGMFGFSLIVLMTMSAAMSLNAWLV